MFINFRAETTSNAFSFYAVLKYSANFSEVFHNNGKENRFGSIFFILQSISRINALLFHKFSFSITNATKARDVGRYII